MRRMKEGGEKPNREDVVYTELRHRQCCGAVPGYTSGCRAHTDDAGKTSRSCWNEGIGTRSNKQVSAGSTFHLHSVQGLSVSSGQSFSSLKFTKFLSTFFCYRHTDFFFFIVIEVAGIARASELWYEWSLNL